MVFRRGFSKRWIFKRNWQTKFTKIFLSKTTRSRALIFGMLLGLVVIHKVCSKYDPGAKMARRVTPFSYAYTWKTYKNLVCITRVRALIFFLHVASPSGLLPSLSKLSSLTIIGLSPDHNWPIHMELSDDEEKLTKERALMNTYSHTKLITLYIT